MAPSPLLVVLLAACAVRIAQPTPVTDWQARVQAAGGDVAAGTLQAHTTFYSALQSANLLGKIARLNTFSGTTLDSALVPLIPGFTQEGGKPRGCRPGPEGTHRGVIQGSFFF
jgi:hypothetical protein